jgi:glyoxylase-like metal-dependent hydrolase (beta-lactamase superfamily II)
MADYLRSFALGRMEMTVIGEGTMKVSPALAYGERRESQWRSLVDLDPQGRMDYGINVLLARTGDRTVLVDTGVGEPHPTRTAFERTYPYVEHTSVLSALDQLGVAAGEVTDVVITHGHGDHLMGATVEREGSRRAAFPNARYLMMRQDWNPQGRDLDSSYMLHLPVIERSGLLELPEGEVEVAAGISMIPAPGESPGHCLVRFESGARIAYFLGDLFHDPVEVSHPDWMWPGRDADRMIASRRALIEAALREEALLVAVHMPFPGLGRIVAEGGGQVWRPVS